MVLRFLLLLGGLLRATKPAPRCETGQETLGKADNPKSPPSSLLPSPGNKERVPASRRGRQELSLSPREEGINSLEICILLVVKLGLCLGSTDGKVGGVWLCNRRTRL